MKFSQTNQIFYLVLVGVGTLLSACQITTSSTSDSDSSSVNETLLNPALEKDLPDGFDYTGTYTGTLPCADCSGIRTVLFLTDSTYTKRTSYLGENRPDLYEASGGASWDFENHILTLGGIAPPNRYLIGENTLTQLDRKGNRIKGELAEKYILLKR